jgi:hypothetical protein
MANLRQRRSGAGTIGRWWIAAAGSVLLLWPLGGCEDKPAGSNSNENSAAPIVAEQKPAPAGFQLPQVDISKLSHWRRRMRCGFTDLPARPSPWAS